ncbi:MAG TPA: hypothetical protein ENK66_03365 [Arcobacter sp.]|nr:hypothetical protein [Arcobacter sp.]
MEILEELEEFISEFNNDNSVDFSIDSIRVEFSKQHKKKELDKLGKWKKLQKNSNILFKLKKRLVHDEITTAYQLEKHNIYYYNMQDAPKYRKAIMVIFGLKQYHEEPPPRTLVSKILAILKDVTNLDICLDVPYQPNLEKFKKRYILDQYITPKGVKTQTHYINNPHIMGIEKVTIYNKGFKNSLNRILWRFEAKMLVHNIKALQLPLYEFKELIEKGR